MKYKLMLDGNEVAKMIDHPTNDLSMETFEFYMRRHNWYYFRSAFSKIKFTCNDIPVEVKDLKYGDNLKFSYK